MKYTVSRAEIDDVLYENKARLSDVSISVRNIQHPKQHGRWGMNLKLSPSIHLDRHTFSTLSTREDGTRYPDIKLRRLSVLGNLKLSTHTPIGAFVLTGGFGGAAKKMTSPGVLDTIRTTEVRKIDFAWIGFLSRRFYVLIGPRYYREQFEQYTFAFRLGYFWGRI
ncbi:hypothetical protein HBN50_09955 [Halobacteriovorax sp. GB3]|uniref:hypothetical protein n=1 Tax=Halobacteriovorax sp. GB3 TaxID=2719615 RepID=UPI00235F57F0|nr:hypothetical protein [Halobacteriovorax sp. GB3]MDD0853423.1 hypothetical protein [Halobacteriovorax sp. GB3]